MGTKKCILEGELPKYGCDKCEDGFIKTYKEWVFGYTTSHCECYKKVDYYKKIFELLGEANIDRKMFQRYDLEAYQQNVLKLEVMYKFITEGEKRLYLQGLPGTGKTYGAFLILMLAVHLEKNILYVSVPKLLDDLRPSPDDLGKERMQRCIDAEVLVMDDIGQEKYTDRVRERLYIIINERYNKGSLTIFTSNISLERLNDKLGHPAIVSRIKWQSLVFDFASVDKRLTLLEKSIK